MTKYFSLVLGLGVARQGKANTSKQNWCILYVRYKVQKCSQIQIAAIAMRAQITHHFNGAQLG